MHSHFKFISHEIFYFIAFIIRSIVYVFYIVIVTYRLDVLFEPLQLNSVDEIDGYVL